MAGRPPKEKSFANMLNIALTAKGATGETKLREVAEVLVSKALEGEPWAVNMVADRVDGKPLQAIEHSGDIGDGSTKDQRDAAFAAAVQAEAEDKKARLN
jgi:hypothetical protein